MNFVRDIKSKLGKSKVIAKLKEVKNVEIVVAVILALVAAVAYFAVTANHAKKTQSAETASSVGMNEAEERLAETISEIAGVGEARVLITTDSGGELIGVVVVAQGAEKTENRIKMIRCVEKATGAKVDQIEIFEMAKGG